MAEVFSLANALQAGDRFKQNEQNREFNTLRLSGERQRQDVEQRISDADQERARLEKTLFGIRFAMENINSPAILSAIGQELVFSSGFDEAELPKLLEQARSNPEQAMRGLAEDEAQLMTALGQGPQFNEPRAGIDPATGESTFGQIDPSTGKSRIVQGFTPPAGSGGLLGVSQQAFEDLIQNFTPEEQKEARRVRARITAPAGSSAQERIAQDPELTEDVAESQAIIAGRKKFAEMTAGSRAKLIDKGFETIQSLDKNIRNIDKAIAALQEGARTGPIVSRFFPSIREASVKLDQIRNELGLDVVGGVTFGALSKGELDLALNVVLPTNLPPDELSQWLQDKKTAQEKLRAYFASQIEFLDLEGNTIAKFLRQQERGASNQGTDQNVAPEGTVITNQQGQTSIKQNGQWVPQ